MTCFEDVFHLFHFVRRIRGIAAIPPEQPVAVSVSVVVQSHGYDTGRGVVSYFIVRNPSPAVGAE